MKLLFFIHSLSKGGAERVMSIIASELACRGHEVYIAIMDNVVEFSLSPNVKLLTCDWNKETSKKNDYFHKIRKIIVKEYYRFKHTKRVINDVRPDIIITFMQCNMKEILLYHRTTPIVHSEHNAYDRNLGLKGWFKRFVLNRYFDRVCVLTPFDLGYAKARLLNNTIVMPNPNTFCCISKSEYERTFSERKNILACGRLGVWYIKGFDILIEAFSKIASAKPNVDLDIAGGYDDNNKQIITKIAEKFGVSERVHLLGQCDNVDELMRQHSLFVLSSRTEGFPMVLTEAMSQGLPCISFERLANSIILDKIDGLLVKDQDSEMLSKSMSILLDNNELRYSMGYEAMKNVSRFSVHSVGDKWVNLIENTIKNYENC